MNRPLQLAAVSAAAVLGLSGCASLGSTSAAAGQPSASAPSAPSPPSCVTQIAAWRNGGGTSQLQAVGNDMVSLGKADTALYDALSAGTDASQQEADLQTVAASVQADSQTANSDLPPDCIPHFHSDLRAGLTDADKAGIDSAQAVSEITSGNYTVATQNILAATRAENAGTAKLTTALGDVKAYNASS